MKQKINYTDLEELNEEWTNERPDSNFQSSVPVKKFIQHIPSMVSGVEPRIDTITCITDVLNLDYVNEFTKSETFYGFAVSVDVEVGKYYNMKLIAMSNYDENYYGCKHWWVVGRFENVIMYETGLPEWTDLKAGHKANCMIRKLNSCDDVFGTFRSDNLKLKVINDLGFNFETMYDFNQNYKCDCGLKK